MKIVFYLLFALNVCACTSVATAQDTLWLGTSNDAWETPSNWTGGLPSSTDVPLINGPVPARLSSTESIESLWIGFLGTGHAIVDGGHLTADADVEGLAFYDHYVGFVGTGELTVDNGGIVHLQSNSTHVAEAPGSEGTINVEHGELHFMNSTFAFGLGGTATMNVGPASGFDQALVVAGAADTDGKRTGGYMADGKTSDAEVNIFRNGEFRWEAREKLRMGRAGSAYINVEGGKAKFESGFFTTWAADASFNVLQGSLTLENGLADEDTLEVYQLNLAKPAYFSLTGNVSNFDDADCRFTFDESTGTADLGQKAAIAFQTPDQARPFNSLTIGVSDAEANDGNMVLYLFQDVFTNELTVNGGFNYSPTYYTFYAKIYHLVDGQYVRLLPGDANLDGVVDVSDFNMVNANMYSTGKSWADGDFNGDRVVDVSDMNIWNAYKFTGPINP